jgi:DNA-binding transcriptional MocR family regulator
LARDGVNVPADRVIISAGSQQGIFAVLSALSRPGDTVLAEELTYPGLKRAAALLGRPVEGVAMDGDGMLPEALDAALAHRPGGLVYCIPTLQNPTAITMPAERRRAIVDVAGRHRAIMVEDGVYAFLDERAPPPLWTLAPERCVYLTSMSKAVSPGLRVGLVVAPEEARARIGAAIAATTMMVPNPLVEIAAMLIEDGSAARSAAEQRAEATARVQLARDIMGAERCPTRPADNLWLVLPPDWRADAFAAEASRRGVLVTQGAAFAVGARVPKAVRVSVSAPRDRERLRTGLETLARLLVDGPDRMTMTV